MFGIGLPELLFILGLGLIVLGPEKLPELAKSLAKGMVELKKTMGTLKESLQEEMKEVADQAPPDEIPWRGLDGKGTEPSDLLPEEFRNLGAGLMPGVQSADAEVDHPAEGDEPVAVDSAAAESPVVASAVVESEEAAEKATVEKEEPGAAHR
ncbi:MAG: twin-arginine translocase TatA/TatE family subunit [Desulfobulbaceae bacterium]|nr:twin-arginine translocase TatA/TatE family subunit [Desulfobulbaceae bacterium]